jgi:site-specific DNA-cytosine methylase
MTGSHISLFSGVGMTDLAAEKLGFKTVATAEIDPFNRRVLRKRFPDAAHFADVRDVRATSGYVVKYAPGVRKVPLLLSGGFPCQDVSNAGTKAGLDGARSGLWTEMLRVISEFQPEYVLAENVAALRSRGLDRVLNDLHHAGYDVQWECIPAGAVGAPHLRDRIWIGAVHRDHRTRSSSGDKLLGAVLRPVRGIARAGAPVTKLPRAGCMHGGLVFERKSAYTIKAAKACMKGEPLPTPTANDDNKSPEAHLAMKARLPGGARRQITSLQVLAKAGFPEDRGRSLSQQLFPTAEDAEAWRNGERPTFPTPTKQDGANNGGPAQMRRNSLPLNAFVRVYPTPSAQDGMSGPGTSPKRAGGKNLRTAINDTDGDYKLSPRWVEWLMGVPQDWTNPDVANDDLVPHNGWIDEPLPRVDGEAPHRRQRLMALGNGLVPQVAAIALNSLLRWSGA